MFLRGRGIKGKLKIFFTRLVKSLFPVGSIYNAPRETVTSQELLSVGKSDSAHMTFVLTESERHESPPVIFNYPVSSRFKRYYKRKVPAAYIIELPGGMVYGDETNFVISSS